MRVAENETASNRVITAFNSRVNAFSTPVLLTLRTHLPKRQAKADIRVYWPKGRVALGVAGPDLRSLLCCSTIQPVIHAIDAELLRRFARKPQFSNCLIDEQQKQIVVPFNERTASASAVSLPRGSRVPVPAGRVIRLFLHLCQPKGGRTTDLDLSVAFYDDAWRYLGGDVDLPEGSMSYALFRERVTPSLSASDLLS